MESALIRVITIIFSSVPPLSDSQKRISWCHLPHLPDKIAMILLHKGDLSTRQFWGTDPIR